jgi:hypothetical protein
VFLGICMYFGSRRQRSVRASTWVMCRGLEQGDAILRHLLMVRKLGLKIYDLKELRVKPIPTWCVSCSHMASASTSRTRTTTSQSKILHSRRRRIRRM